jgi:hypothetical protein
MSSSSSLLFIVIEGRKGGREEGRKEGRKGGRKEERKKGKKEGRKEGRKERGQIKIFFFQVLPLSSKQTNAKIEDIREQLLHKSSEFNPRENPQNVIQLVTSASSLINSDKDQNTENKKKLRKLMVEKLSEIESDDLPLIAEKCNALSVAIENKNEVSSDTQVTQAL